MIKILLCQPWGHELVYLINDHHGYFTGDNHSIVTEQWDNLEGYEHTYCLSQYSYDISINL